MGSASETSSNTEESHYGNNHLTSTPNNHPSHQPHCSQHHQFASSAAIYGRIGHLRGAGSHSRERPQSVYEKQFGPVQQLLSSPPMTQPRSQQQVSIGQATVVNLVKTQQSTGGNTAVGTSKTESTQPPPLPPRPAGGLNTSFSNCPPSVEPKPQLMKHSSASLPRNTHQKKMKKLLLESSSPTTSTAAVVKRQSFHDGTTSALSLFSKPILKSLEDSVEDKSEPKVCKA